MNETKVIGTITVVLVAALLIFARRYKNPDKNAGYGIAGWTMVILLLIWV